MDIMIFTIMVIFHWMIIAAQNFTTAHPCYWPGKWPRCDPTCITSNFSLRNVSRTNNIASIMFTSYCDSLILTNSTVAILKPDYSVSYGLTWWPTWPGGKWPISPRFSDCPVFNAEMGNQLFPYTLNCSVNTLWVTWTHIWHIKYCWLIHY